MRGKRQFFDAEGWLQIAPSLAALTQRGPKGDLRAFLEGVVWILRTGAPWRDLSTRFGRWDRIYRRYRRWALAGRWESLRAGMLSRERRGFLLIDSTIVKAHPHAAGARSHDGGQETQALGRSRGGFTTKLHALVTATGRLVRYVLTAGQVNDISQARVLVPSREGLGVIGDRAYDSDAFVTHIKQLRMRTVIPPRRNRRQRRRFDRARYRDRNVIERWFGPLKAFRRVATRYDKTSASYVGFVATAAMLVAFSRWRG